MLRANLSSLNSITYLRRIQSTKIYEYELNIQHQREPTRLSNISKFEMQLKDRVVAYLLIILQHPSKTLKYQNFGAESQNPHFRR